MFAGYAKTALSLSKLSDFIRYCKERNPQLIYIMDPVLGDNGQLYVNADVLPVYLEKLLPLADLITPNQYELQ